MFHRLGAYAIFATSSTAIASPRSVSYQIDVPGRRHRMTSLATDSQSRAGTLPSRSLGDRITPGVYIMAAGEELLLQARSEFTETICFVY